MSCCATRPVANRSRASRNGPPGRSGSPPMIRALVTPASAAAASAVRYSRTRSPRRDAQRLTILADPNAAGFYQRNGAVRIGEAPSDAVPGRLPPLYEVRLEPVG